MKTAEERATNVALLKKHQASIVRFKYAAAKLSGRDGYDNASNMATDLEDVVATELEAARNDGIIVGEAKHRAESKGRYDAAYDQGYRDGQAFRAIQSSPLPVALDYEPPTSKVWPLIDLCEHNNAPMLLRHERDVLAVAIAEAALTGGVWNGETMIGGPALVMLAQDMGEALAEQREVGEAESAPLSATVHGLANEWAAIPIAVRDLFVHAMCNGVGVELRKMPDVNSDKGTALQNAYMTVIEIVHAMADLGGAATSTAPNEGPSSVEPTPIVAHTNAPSIESVASKPAPNVRKVGPKRGPLSRLESIALDLRMAADALIELDDEVHSIAPRFNGILASHDKNLFLGSVRWQSTEENNEG